MASQDLSLRIIEAGLEQFGRCGFDGSSTRDIAKASGTAMSSITYHFGGKHGLYLACADHIATQIGAIHAPLLALVGERPPQDAAQARTYLLALLENFARFMLAPQSESYCQFIVREQQHPTEAFERIYERVMQPVMETAVALLVVARTDLEDKARRALIANVMGMALVLRIGRACVSRLMQVDDLDEATSDYLIAGLRRSAQTLLLEE